MQNFIQIAEIRACVCSYILTILIEYVKKEPILLYFYTILTRFECARRDSNHNMWLYKIDFFIHFVIQKHRCMVRNSHALMCGKA